MNNVKINVIKFIKEELKGMEEAFKNNLGVEYKVLLKEKQELYTENHELRSEILQRDINRKEETIVEINNDIEKITIELQKLVVSEGFEENVEESVKRIEELRSNLRTLRQDKTNAAEELVDLTDKHDILIHNEKTITEALSKYPKNHYTLAIEWINKNILDNENEAETEQQKYFHEFMGGLEQLMTIHPYKVEFDIDENVDEGLSFVSLVIGDVRLELDEYNVGEEADYRYHEPEITKVNKYGFDNELVSVTDIRELFMSEKPTFEWFQTGDNEIIIESFFIENKDASNEKEDYIRIGVNNARQEKLDNRYERFINTKAITITYSKYPNSI